MLMFTQTHSHFYFVSLFLCSRLTALVELELFAPLNDFFSSSNTNGLHPIFFCQFLTGPAFVWPFLMFHYRNTVSCSWQSQYEHKAPFKENGTPKRGSVLQVYKNGNLRVQRWSFSTKTCWKNVTLQMFLERKALQHNWRLCDKNDW